MYDPQSLNRYAYCLNNPLIYNDPSGATTEHYDETMATLGTEWGLEPKDSEISSYTLREKAPDTIRTWVDKFLNPGNWELDQGAENLMAIVDAATLFLGTAAAKVEQKIVQKVERALASVGSGSGLGDLTTKEVKQIQKVVDEAGRPLEVVGSAVKSKRRNPGSNLPIGKGPGTKSDIDYLVPSSSRDYYKGIGNQLPEIDPKSGIIPGTHNPHIGPAIRFEPGIAPDYVPGF